MEITETLYVKDRKKWRTWLEKHHASKKEIWLIYYKKHTGKPRIPYGDAVEEAICYGWIDSTVKRLDEEKYCQRFTPRNYKSIWSDINIMRLKKMLDAERMEQPGLDKVPPDIMNMARSGNILPRGPAIPEELETPKDLENALNENPDALENWKRFAPSHRKMYTHWVMDAKRPETKERRISRVVGFAKENKKTMM
jgi:uncharacterized protein YdeI (YjbR/CyaY-like superfamily)